MSNQTPDATQIRAAMAMLSWENDDLAKAADIAASSVHNIKRGLTRPQPRILTAIRAVFEAQGLEFIDNSGVRHRPEGVEVLNGQEGMIRLFDTIYEHAQTTDDYFCQNSLDDNLLIKFLGDYTQRHIERMKKLHVDKPHFKVNVIINGNSLDFPCSDYAEYRRYPRDIPPPVPYYIFDDNLVIFAFQSDPPPKILLIKSAVIAEAYRQQFDQLWQIASVPLSSRIKK